MAVLGVVDGVAQHALGLGLGEDLGPDGPVGVGGDHEEGAGKIATLVAPLDVGEFTPAHEVAKPVRYRRGYDDDVGVGLEQGPGLALGLGATAGHDAPPAGELEGDGITERHRLEARARP